MERYGVVLLAFSLILAIAGHGTTMVGLLMTVPSILLIGYGERQVDGAI